MPGLPVGLRVPVEPARGERPESVRWTLVRAGLVLAVLGVGATDIAAACTCRSWALEPWPGGRFESADAVFVGRLESVQAKWEGHDEVRTLQFRTESWWKGTASQDVAVLTGDNGAGCGMRDWAVGTVLLVFAQEGEGTLYSGMCSGNTSDLSRLGALGEPVAHFELPPLPVSAARKAVRAGDGAGLKAALEAGDDPREQRPDGTLLELALAACDPALVGPLASGGALPPEDAVDRIHACPVAAQGGLLVAAGPVLSDGTRLAALNAAIAEGRNDRVRRWFDSGLIDVAARPKTATRIPLVVAIEAGNAEAERLLEARGATVGRLELLGLAAGRSEQSRARLLASTPSPDDATYLLSRAPWQVEVVRHLLARGAAPDGDGFRGRSPAALAAERGVWEVVFLLFEADATLDPATLRSAAWQGNLRQVRALLALGIRLPQEEIERARERAGPEITALLMGAD